MAELRPTERIMIFVACISFGLLIVAELGLGGAQMANMPSWEFFGWALGIATAGAIIAIIAGYAASGTEVKVLGTGVKLGDKLAKSAAVLFWDLLYLALVLYASLFFWQIPSIGPLFAGIFGVIATLVFLIDLFAYTGGK